MIGSEETGIRVSDGFNGAVATRNDREGACAKTRPALTVARRENMSRLTMLRRGARQCAVTERKERLAGPMRREMEPETSDAPAHATCDFEQLESDCSDGRGRQARAREDVAPEVREQQQRDAMQLQSEGVRAEAMTAKAIGVDVEFEFLNPILGRAAIVIPRDKIRGSAAAVRDHEADVDALRRDVDLDQKAAVMWPGFRPMPKTGASVDGTTGPIVPRLRLRDESRHARLEDAIGADTQHVADPFGFQLRFDPRRRHARIAAQGRSACAEIGAAAAGADAADPPRHTPHSGRDP